jgi:dTDP-4-amino-4,6-dideoxygalactose transaminase
MKKIMLKKPQPFDGPIYVTRPSLPPLKEYIGEIRKIWDSRWLTNNGSRLHLFENKLNRFLKTKDISAVSSGTIALMLACKALELSGEVITTPFTCAATPHALAWNGIKPVFCDLEAGTLNIDPQKIEALMTPRTTAIMPVHLFGIPCDVKMIKKIADKHDLKVIYDAAHAFGVEVGGKGIMDFGDVSAISFHATKVFHTAEGGALASGNKKIAEKIRILRNIGIKNELEIPYPGINAKMSELQAALGIINLNYFAENRKKRRKIVEVYRHLLKDIEGVSLPESRPGITYNYSYFPIRINEKEFGKTRDLVLYGLRRYNIFARKYFYPLCSDLPHFKDLPSSSPSGLPVAQKAVKEILVLPLYGDLSSDDVERICSIIKELRN